MSDTVKLTTAIAFIFITTGLLLRALSVAL